MNDAAELLSTHYGLAGSLKELGSHQDRNFLLDGGDGRRYVLKICHGDYATSELDAQHAALRHLGSQSNVRVPGVMSALNGKDLLSVDVGGHAVHVRLLEFIDGQSLAHVEHLSRHVMVGLAELCAQVDVALANFEHPGLERILQWDPRHASALIKHLLPVIDSAEKRACIAEAAEQAHAHLLPLIAALPVQAIHMDITEYNVVWARDGHAMWQLQGLIDFGDLVRTWRIADLSVTCAALLHHAEGDPLYILPAIQAYHAINPLQLEELQALWPLIVARSAVLVLSSEQQASIEPDNAYIQANLASEWNIFDVATSVPIALMNAAILDAVGLLEGQDDAQTYSPLLPSLNGQAFTTVDLGVLSEHFNAGNWEQSGIDEQLLKETAHAQGLAASRYGEYRLSRTLPDSAREPDTFALHVEVVIPHGTAVHAPFHGTLRHTADGALMLVGAESNLRVWGVRSDFDSGVEFGAGDVIGQGGGSLIVQLCSEPDVSPPLFCTPSRAAAWRSLCPSPQGLLGFECDAPPLEDSLHTCSPVATPALHGRRNIITRHRRRSSAAGATI